MEDTQERSRRPLGVIMAILGGALMTIGSFLAWAEVSGGGTTVTAKGTDGSDGYITLAERDRAGRGDRDDPTSDAARARGPRDRGRPVAAWPPTTQ